MNRLEKPLPAATVETCRSHCVLCPVTDAVSVQPPFSHRGIASDVRSDE